MGELLTPTRVLTGLRRTLSTSGTTSSQARDTQLTTLCQTLVRTRILRTLKPTSRLKRPLLVTNGFQFKMTMDSGPFLRLPPLIPTLTLILEPGTPSCSLTIRRPVIRYAQVL